MNKPTIYEIWPKAKANMPNNIHILLAFPCVIYLNPNKKSPRKPKNNPNVTNTLNGMCPSTVTDK